ARLRGRAVGRGRRRGASADQGALVPVGRNDTDRAGIQPGVAILMARASQRTALDRTLGLFTEVRPGEGPTGLWMLASVFLILAAYYFVKPARDGLLAVSPAGGLSDTELKAYSSFGQSLCLLAALPAYDLLSRALPRTKLV